RERRAPNALELLTRIVPAECLPRAVDIRVQQPPCEEALDRLVREADRVGDRDEPENQTAQQRGAPDATPVARSYPPGAHGREDRQELPAPDAADAQPGPRSQDERPNCLRPPQRQPQADHPA